MNLSQDQTCLECQLAPLQTAEGLANEYPDHWNILQVGTVNDVTIDTVPMI